MSKGTRYKKNEKSENIKKIISLVFLLFFFILFIVSGIKIINYLKDAKKNEKLIYEISKDIEVERDNNDNNAIRYNISKGVN